MYKLIIVIADVITGICYFIGKKSSKGILMKVLKPVLGLIGKLFIPCLVVTAVLLLIWIIKRFLKKKAKKVVSAASDAPNTLTHFMKGF